MRIRKGSPLGLSLLFLIVFIGFFFLFNPLDQNIASIWYLLSQNPFEFLTSPDTVMGVAIVILIASIIFLIANVSSGSQKNRRF